MKIEIDCIGLRTRCKTSHSAYYDTDSKILICLLKCPANLKVLACCMMCDKPSVNCGEESVENKLKFIAKLSKRIK